MKKTAVITLPNSVTLHTLKSFLQRNSFFDNGVTKYKVKFLAAYCHMEPFVLSMLAAWSYYCSNRQIPIELDGTIPKSLDYAHRMGLFNFLPIDYRANIITHEQTGTFVSLTKLESKSDISEFIGELLPILHKHHPNHAESVKYCLSELSNNVIEHAGITPAFACAQFYKKSKSVSIGVADCGIGIKESLSNSMTINNHHEGIIESLKPGTSGSVHHLYGSPENAGAGLFFNKCVSYTSGEYFGVISGDSAFRLRKKQLKTSINNNPEDDRHDIYDGLPIWKGTIVGVNVSQHTKNEFNMLSQRIWRAYNRNYTSKRKREINFT